MVEARSRDREADNHQLLLLEEKDMVSSVATVLSDLCGPGEWMPMEKLHAEVSSMLLFMGVSMQIEVDNVYWMLVTNKELNWLGHTSIRHKPHIHYCEYLDLLICVYLDLLIENFLVAMFFLSKMVCYEAWLQFLYVSYCMFWRLYVNWLYYQTGFGSNFLGRKCLKVYVHSPFSTFKALTYTSYLCMILSMSLFPAYFCTLLCGAV